MEKNTTDSVLIHVRDVIASELDIASLEIKPSTTLASLVTDSLEMLNLIMELEGEFDLIIEERDLEKLLTVQDVVKYIEARK